MANPQISGLPCVFGMVWITIV